MIETLQKKEFHALSVALVLIDEDMIHAKLKSKNARKKERKNN